MLLSLNRVKNSFAFFWELWQLLKRLSAARLHPAHDEVHHLRLRILITATVRNGGSRDKALRANLEQLLIVKNAKSLTVHYEKSGWNLHGDLVILLRWLEIIVAGSLVLADLVPVDHLLRHRWEIVIVLRVDYVAKLCGLLKLCLVDMLSAISAAEGLGVERWSDLIQVSWITVNAIRWVFSLLHYNGISIEILESCKTWALNVMVVLAHLRQLRRRSRVFILNWIVKWPGSLSLTHVESAMLIEYATLPSAVGLRRFFVILLTPVFVIPIFTVVNRSWRIYLANDILVNDAWKAAIMLH